MYTNIYESRIHGPTYISSNCDLRLLGEMSIGPLGVFILCSRWYQNIGYGVKSEISMWRRIYTADVVSIEIINRLLRGNEIYELTMTAVFEIHTKSMEHTNC